MFYVFTSPCRKKKDLTVKPIVPIAWVLSRLYKKKLFIFADCSSVSARQSAEEAAAVPPRWRPFRGLLHRGAASRLGAVHQQVSVFLRGNLTLCVFSTSCSQLAGILLCVYAFCSQDRRSPARPERTLSSHVSAGGNHRPQLRSWKSTALGLCVGWVGEGLGVVFRPSGLSVLSHLCPLFHFLVLCRSLFHHSCDSALVCSSAHHKTTWVTLFLLLSLCLNFIFVQYAECR